MKKIIGSLLFCSVVLFTTAQNDFTNTGTLYISGSTDTFFVNGHFTNSSAAALTNNGKFYTKQNFINSQTSWTIGTGEVILNGTGDQLISSVSNSAFYKLTINKSSGLATLASAVTINNTLTLTTGKLSLDNYDITIGNSASITGGSTNAYLIATGTGELKQQIAASGSKIFPVGTSTAYTPVTVSLTAASITDVFHVRMLTAVYRNGTSGSVLNSNAVNATWMVSEAVNGGSDATLTCQWPASLELTGFDRQYSRLAHYTTSAWDYGFVNLNASGSNPYSVSRSGFSSFSPFAVMMNMAVLPVTSLEIFGKQNGNENLINWSTLSEAGTAYFSIEASMNGTDFTETGKVNAAGNSSNLRSYSFVHRNINNQSYSYRIKQVDENGSFVYSKVIRLTATALHPAALFPNPVKHKTTISFSLKQTSLMTVMISNTQGQAVYKWKQLYSKGDHKTELDLSLLPAGSYTLQLKDDTGSVQSMRFIKTN
ncbi:MAG: T9SS type A sorting domain-containing protein [Chitinophagaceae bacterium]|jgi:fibronectin-binding autotransporter adhesin|nr:T9SS type A sorting domain-containing protein [Chitinophagaceae bacterium]